MDTKGFVQRVFMAASSAIKPWAQESKVQLTKNACILVKLGDDLTRVFHPFQENPGWWNIINWPKTSKTLTRCLEVWILGFGKIKLQIR